MERNKIFFISTMDGDPWGGSEELWSQTALRLVAEGYSVSASVLERGPPHPRVVNLLERGVKVSFRPARYPLRKLAWHYLTAQPKTTTLGALIGALELQRILAANPPDLVVLSNGGPLPPIDLIEVCNERRVPFVTIGQANRDEVWPGDALAARYRTALSAARGCYFVSEANLRLLEKQIGCTLQRAEVVRNPFNVDYDVSLPWPEPSGDDELRFACVARLEPAAKGQDILFEALAKPPWADRRWRLHLYGQGNWRCGLERLARRLGLSDRVVFEGHVSPEQIWALNHVLVMPSRYEGLPLAIIEAMLCGRPVIATDVAGHAEVIEDGVTGFLAAAPTVHHVFEALERFWARRIDAQDIGAEASKSIRRLVPPDPVGIFTRKIEESISV